MNRRSLISLLCGVPMLGVFRSKHWWDRAREMRGTQAAVKVGIAPVLRQCQACDGAGYIWLATEPSNNGDMFALVIRPCGCRNGYVEVDG